MASAECAAPSPAFPGSSHDDEGPSTNRSPSTSLRASGAPKGPAVRLARAAHALGIALAALLGACGEPARPPCCRCPPGGHG